MSVKNCPQTQPAHDFNRAEIHPCIAPLLHNGTVTNTAGRPWGWELHGWGLGPFAPDSMSLFLPGLICSNTREARLLLVPDLTTAPSILLHHVYLDIYLDARSGVLSLGRCFPSSTGIFVSLKIICCHDTATKPKKYFQHWSCTALLFYINRNGRQHHSLGNLVNNAFPCKHGVPKLCLCWSQFSPYELK